MSDNRAFEPLYTKTAYLAGVLAQQGQNVAGVIGVAGVASSASPEIPGNKNLNNNCQIRVSNKTSVWVHVNFGVFGNVRAATLSDLAIAPGLTVTATVDPEVNGATLISDGAPATSTVVLFQRGGGT